MTEQSIREAAKTLAEFARTAPGCPPERVELAIKAVEAEAAVGSDEDTLSTIRDVLGLEDNANAEAVVERLIALLPQSAWTQGEKPDSWYRCIVGTVKRVVQVYRYYGNEKWRRSSYLHGEHEDRYASAGEAMRAADDEAWGPDGVPPMLDRFL